MDARPWLVAAALLLGLDAGARPKTKNVRDFTLDDYATTWMEGWTVRLHPALLTDPTPGEPPIGREAQRVLEHELFEAARALPEAALEHLRSVPIWLSVGEERWPGGVYHPSPEWLEENGYDPRLAGSIQIGDAATFLAWERDQPSILIHELAHAWHHQVLGYDHRGLIDAFETANASGAYEGVLRNGGRVERAYALTNVQEYFAELTEAAFGTNDFFPFVRVELAGHDPGGLAAVLAAWEQEAGR